MKKVLLLLLLLCTSCMIPNLPAPGTCRSFAISSWGGGAPWDELHWGTEVVWIDEPLIPTWRTDSDMGNPDWVRAETDKLRIRIDEMRVGGKIVWINWATEEQDTLEALDIPLGLNADVVSIDSYGGPWDWWFNTQPRLNKIHDKLLPGQLIGLVPEAHYAPDWGVPWSESDEAAIAAFYLDYAFNHDRIYAVAPFTWGPGPGTMAERPFVAAQYNNAAHIYPRCQ